MATMVGNASEVVQQILQSGNLKFRNLKLPNIDFSGHNLQGADFRGAAVPYCNFSRCNLKFANFENANCYGTQFEDADLHRANFKDAQMSDSSIGMAKDLYGVTFTLECKSFQGIKIDSGWWYGWLFYGLLMKPPSQEAEDKLIQMMGIERYSVLRDQYARRRM
jgi:uncharacterized protein YjbI with pentapeptide repeats